MTNDPVYSACAAFANELANQGVGHAVISPGSRSTPLTLTFARTDRIETWTRLDERSAAFFALGLAKESCKPVVLICTSGTAAANYLPAVIEANWS
ncbi:MAG: thiamine pyrophosphate-binding protein, partial [Actinomycetota bacterium]|nr:thiamine pyrophosphate-binding protein [Actinomycetota bacterium]